MEANLFEWFCVKVERGNNKPWSIAELTISWTNTHSLFLVFLHVDSSPRSLSSSTHSWVMCPDRCASPWPSPTSFGNTASDWPIALWWRGESLNQSFNHFPISSVNPDRNAGVVWRSSLSRPVMSHIRLFKGNQVLFEAEFALLTMPCGRAVEDSGSVSTIVMVFWNAPLIYVTLRMIRELYRERAEVGQDFLN